MKKTSFGKKIIRAAVLAFLLMSGTSLFAQGEKSHIYNFVYRPKPMQSMYQALQTISRILNDMCVHVSTFQDDVDGITIHLTKIKYKKAIVTDQGIELISRSGTVTIDFSKLFFEQDIKVNRFYQFFTDAKTGKRTSDHYHDMIIDTKTVKFTKDKGSFGVTFPDPSMYPTCNLQLADALFTIQKKLNKSSHKSELEAFKLLAARYRAMQVKPSMSEDQRKYIVQANFFSRQKKYEKAIDLYKKTIEIDPTTYPAAYNNLALLYAQIKSYSTAIYYMRKFLLLEPDSKDARAAQDKIYEWDAIVNPPK